LFYYPDSRVYSTPAGAGLPYQDVWFTSRDGTKLHGWFIPAASQGPALGTVVHFHGNAQNMTAHVSFVSWLPAEGFNVFKKARQPKQLLTMPGVGHTAAAGSTDIRRQIVAFMKQALQSAQP
jgi:cephalosporin-C deacetylase-like acetyl esterase